MKNVTDIKQFIRHFCFIQSFGSFIIGFIAPIMYVVLKEKGFAVVEIGFLVLCTSVTTILLEVPCGVLSDRIGRKLLFLLGQFCFLFYCLAMFLSESLTIIAIAMTLAGLSAAMASGTLDALFVDTLNEENKSPEFLQQNLGKLGMYNMLGMFIGALLSSVFINNQVNIFSVSGFEYNYGIVALLLPLHMVVTAVLVKEPSQSSPHVERLGLASMFRQAFIHLSEHKTLMLLMTSSAFGSMAYISFEKFWQLQLANIVDNGEMKWIFGILFAVSLLIGALGHSLSYTFCRVFNNNYVNANIVIRVMQALLFLSLYLTSHLWGFLAIFLLIFFVSALSLSPVMTLLHSEIKDNQRSTMLSFRSVFIQLGASVGIVVAALVSHFSSLHVAFLVSAVIYLLSIGLLMMPAITDLGARLSSASEK